ncbi:hypothetical protein PENTCL1PPCAC_30818 [Pristionchus entomophagus]|uniref:Uncharacterized protein n=1 Tax=Pristionchus entomophagus TaxID=358040 RepID=A0AAV5UNN9_9BILA|nr:hypothetical protein PENTCL1PPCAC_30818 [Pristionchus entomophagus]
MQKRNEDDLGFSDLIFWTTSASNPSYDPAAFSTAETEIVEDNGKNSDEESEAMMCNPLDGSCGNFQEILLDAELVAQTQNKQQEICADTAGDQNKMGDDENEEEQITVIRF